MARISGALFSSATGSVGNLTLTTQQGRVIMKSKATEVANPKTAGQVAQRDNLSQAVIAWQMVGNVIASGWTVKKQYCGAYQSFVSKNIALFAPDVFTAENFKMADIVGKYATNGNLGTLQIEPDSIDQPDPTFYVTKQSLSSAAKVGDKIKIIMGGGLSTNAFYGEIPVTQALLNSPNPQLEFTGLNYNGNGEPVYAIWVESADGSKSTTQKFEQS